MTETVKVKPVKPVTHITLDDETNMVQAVEGDEVIATIHKDILHVQDGDGLFEYVKKFTSVHDAVKAIKILEEAHTA